MSRPGITYQEVANAAIQLQGQNENPTVDRVREILTTGSKSTIARYLKDWKSKTGHINGAEGVPHELISIVKGLWEGLRTTSDKRIEQHQEETNRIITEIKQTLSQEQKHNSDSQTTICQLEEQLHQEKYSSQSLGQSLEEEKRTNAKLSERNDRLAQQLSDQKSETERLHQLLSHVQNNLEHYQASVQKLREEQILLIEKQRTEYEREITSLKHEASAAFHQKNNLQLQINQIENGLKLTNVHNHQLIEENCILQKQLKEKTINEAILHEKYNQLDKSCLNYQKKCEEQSEVNIELEKKLAVISNQTTSLQASLSEAQDKIQILRDEKLFLAQEKSHLEGQLKQLETQL